MANWRRNREFSGESRLARREGGGWPVVALLVVGMFSGADWPTYQHDVRRSGHSDEALDVSRLRQSWTWRSAQPPQPAWGGPARWDAYSGRRDLPSMRNYDLAFHAIAVGDAVYFGSSVDDTLRCLDARDGRLAWSFTADGPIRLAPTWADDRVYFGSDDGHAYCLRADTGQVAWRFQPPGLESAQKIVNDGRLIPLHPCRTGVLVDGGTAYCGFGLLPWEDTYLCALDAATGQADGAGRFVRKLSNLTLEAAPAALADAIVFPQGRVAPQAFRRGDGASQGPLKHSGGGSLVVVALDSTIFHGPGANPREGELRGSDPRTLEMIVEHGRGRAMVCAGPRCYVLTDDSLAASDLAKRQQLWIVPSEWPYALVSADQTLFAGGRDEVVALNARDGRVVWRRPVQGRAYGLAVASGRLLVSTDEGVLYCFDTAASAAPAEATDDGSAADDAPRQAAREAAHGSTQTPLADAEPVDDPDLLGRWVFQRPQVMGSTVRDLTGRTDARVLGGARLERVGDRQALMTDGRTHSVRIADSFRRAAMPSAAMTAEAWVRIDQGLAWGGIVGAFQDNGDDEHGWILGYRNAKFSFALAGAQGNGRLTYLTAEADFVPRRWSHVVGTYDGATMKLYVDGALAGSSTVQRGDIRYPPEAFYEIGAYHDRDEYNRLCGRIHEVRVYGRALTPDEVAAHHAAAAAWFPEPTATPESANLRLAAGPWMQFVEPGAAVVRWRSSAPTASVLECGLDDTSRRIVDRAAKTEHEIRIDGLRPNQRYWYAIRDGLDEASAEAERFECDTFHNYTLAPISGAADARFDDATGTFSRAAEAILSRTGARRGICLVYGSGDGRLAYQLARRSSLRVIGVDADPARVAASRAALMAADVYGARVAIHHVPSLDALPVIDRFANLVVSERMLIEGDVVGRAAEALRVARPDGGVVCLGQTGASARGLTAAALRTWLADGGVPADVSTDGDGVWAVYARPPMDAAGEWTHLYGSADNSAYGGERLGGASSARELAVQWLGRPGPTYQADRNGRKPSPLATAGRLYVQGMRRILALDAYNGSPLWSVELAGFERFNMPRDCGNWCADREYVYAAVRDKCWRIDAASGRVVDQRDVIPGGPADGPYDWGYVASVGGRLVGSAVKQGASWTNFWGGTDAGWYDSRTGPVTFPICSDSLFALDKATGRCDWTYTGGVILNSTITAADGRIYFVESRHPEVKASPERRIGKPELWEQQYLVALDAETGSAVWQQPLDIQHGTVVFYLAHSEDRLVIVASTNGAHHVYGFSAERGEPIWRQQVDWPEGRGDHGKAMSRPAIVGGQVYVRPGAFSLADGSPAARTVPLGGCGTYCCTANTLVYRAGTVTLWDRATGSASGWARLRPDCWLSTIPAAGMLLSPEGGGGCSCGGWLETSIAFMPRSARAAGNEGEQP